MKISTALFLPCLLFASISMGMNQGPLTNITKKKKTDLIHNTHPNHSIPDDSSDQNPPHADSLLLNPWLGAQAGKILNAWDTMSVDTRFKVLYGFKLAVLVPASLYNHDIYLAEAAIIVPPIMFLLAKKYLPVNKDGTHFQSPW